MGGFLRGAAGDHAVYSPLALAVLAALGGLLLLATHASADTTVPGGVIDSSATWTASGSPYVVTGTVTVRNNAVLTVEPGVTVRLDPGATIRLGSDVQSAYGFGAISVAGTHASPVVFESTNPGAATHLPFLTFHSIFENGASGTIAHASFGPQSNAHLRIVASGAITVSNATFTGAQYAIDGSAQNAYATVRDSVFQDQTVRHARMGARALVLNATGIGTGSSIQLIGGGALYSSSLRIGQSAIPYELVDPFTMYNAATLTIDAGVRLKFAAGAYVGLGRTSCSTACTGILDASGRPDARIRLEAMSPSSTTAMLQFTGTTTDSGVGTLRHVDVIGHAGTSLYLAQTTAVRVENSTFEGGSYAIDVSAWNSGATLHDTSFANQTSRAARLGLQSTVTNASSQPPSTIQILGGNILRSSPLRFTAAGIPYELVDPFTMYNDATLTIEPGVHLKFADGAYVGLGRLSCSCTYRGVLDASGTADRPIVLEALSPASTTALLQFTGAAMNSGEGALRHVTLRGHAGPSILLAQTTAVRIENSTLVGGTYALSASAWNSGATIHDTRFDGQTIAPARLGLRNEISNVSTANTSTSILLMGGSTLQSSPVTITAAGTPYELLDPFTMHAGATLTIQPGVHLRFASGAYLGLGRTTCSSSCAYTGILEATGTPESPIVLEAASPASTTPLVQLTGAASNSGIGRLRWVDFRGHAGASMLLGQTTDVVIENSTFRGGSYGIDVTAWNSGATIHDTRFDGQTIRPARLGLRNVVSNVSTANTTAAILLTGGGSLQSSDVRMTAAGVPYELSDSFTMHNGATLALDPGVHLAFATNTFIGLGRTSCSSTCTYTGILNASGTAEKPIRIESWNVSSTTPLLQLTGAAQDSGVATLRWVDLRGHAGASILLAQTAALRIENSTLRGGTYAVNVTAWNSGATIHDTRFENQTLHPVRLGLRNVVSNVTTAGTTPRLLLTGGGSAQSSSIRVTAAGTPYELSDSFTMFNGAMLTIEAGAHVTFANGATIGVGHPSCGTCTYQGYLDASGTAAAPIVLESLHAGATTPLLQFTGAAANSGAGTLRWVEVRGHAGPSMLLAQTTAVTIENSTFVGGAYAIDVTAWNSGATIRDTHFEDQTVRPVRLGLRNVVSNVSTSNTTPRLLLTAGGSFQSSSIRITAAGTPYELSESFTMFNGATLTIDPGAHVTFANGAFAAFGHPSCSCTYLGVLEALGTPDAPIVLEALDAAATAPLLRFTGAATNSGAGTLRWAEVRGHAGPSMLLAQTTAVTIENTTFRGGSYAIDVTAWNSGATIRETLFDGQSIRPARLGLRNVVSNVTTANTTPRLLLVGGDGFQSSPIRLMAGGTGYELAGSFTMFNGATLSIDAGARLAFANGAFIGLGHPSCGTCTYQGYIDASGASGAPIVLEALDASATTPMLQFTGAATNSGAGTLRWVDLSGHAGPSILLGQTTAVTIENSTLIGGTYAIDSQGWFSGATLRDTRFVDQTVRHARLGLRTVAANVTGVGSGASLLLVGGETNQGSSLRIGGSGIPFELADGFTMYNGATLTIEPGTTLRFRDAGQIRIGYEGSCSNCYSGALMAVGTAASPIVFEPAPGATPTIPYVRSASPATNAASGTIEHVTIRGGSGAAVRIERSANFEIENFELSGGGLGIELVNAPSSIRLGTILGGARGVTATQGAVTIHGLAISGTTEAAIVLDRAHGSTIAGSTIRNGAVGIRLIDTDNALIHSNRIVANALGFAAGASSTGGVYHDNLFASADNVDDDAASSQWFVAPAAGLNVCGGGLVAGNWWSTYFGNDTNGDGIGDTDVPHRLGIAGYGDGYPLAATDCDTDVRSLLPDVALRSDEMRTDLPYRSGANSTLRFVARNPTPFAAVDVLFSVYQDGALLQNVTLPLLEAFDQHELSVPLPVPAASNDTERLHVYRVVADPMNSTAEASERNNEATRAFIADRSGEETGTRYSGGMSTTGYVLPSPQLPGQEGTFFGSATYSFFNPPEPAAGAEVLVVIDNGTAARIVTRTDGTFQFPLSFGASGAHVVNLTASDGTFIAFADVPVQVDPIHPAGVDLVPTSLSFSSGRPSNVVYPGDTVALSVRIANVGDTNATQSFPVDVYLDSDVIHTFTVDGLPGTGGTLTLSTTYTIPEDLASSYHRFRAKVDGGNDAPTSVIAEFNERNNEVCGFRQGDCPNFVFSDDGSSSSSSSDTSSGGIVVSHEVQDLSVGGPGVSDARPIAGQAIVVSASAINVGDRDVIASFASTLALDGATLELRRVGGLARSASVDLGTTVQIHEPGWHTFSVRADTDQEVSEHDEQNNRREASVHVFPAAPMLVAERASVSTDKTVPRETTITVAGTIRNDGGYAATVPYRIYDDGALVGSGTVVVPPKWATAGTASFPVTLHTAGVHTITLVVDPDNEVAEYQDCAPCGRHVATATVSVREWMPNLVPTISAPSAPYFVDYTEEVVVGVRNVGETWSGSVLACINGWGLLEQWNATVPGLPPGGEWNVSLTWAPTTEGHHRVSITADCHGWADELREDDNSTYADVLVRQARPDLAIQIDAVQGTDAYAGIAQFEPFLVSFTVTSMGDIPSNASVAEVRIGSTLACSVPVPSLPVGASHSHSCLTTAPGGNRVVIAQIFHPGPQLNVGPDSDSEGIHVRLPTLRILAEDILLANPVEPSAPFNVTVRVRSLDDFQAYGVELALLVDDSSFSPASPSAVVPVGTLAPFAEAIRTGSISIDAIGLHVVKARPHTLAVETGNWFATRGVIVGNADDVRFTIQPLLIGSSTIMELASDEHALQNGSVVAYYRAFAQHALDQTGETRHPINGVAFEFATTNPDAPLQSGMSLRQFNEDGILRVVLDPGDGPTFSAWPTGNGTMAGQAIPPATLDPLGRPDLNATYVVRPRTGDRTQFVSSEASAGVMVSMLGIKVGSAVEESWRHDLSVASAEREPVSGVLTAETGLGLETSVGLSLGPLEIAVPFLGAELELAQTHGTIAGAQMTWPDATDPRQRDLIKLQATLGVLQGLLANPLATAYDRGEIADHTARVLAEIAARVAPQDVTGAHHGKYFRADASAGFSFSVDLAELEFELEGHHEDGSTTRGISNVGHTYLGSGAYLGVAGSYETRVRSGVGIPAGGAEKRAFTEGEVTAKTGVEWKAFIASGESHEKLRKAYYRVEWDPADHDKPPHWVTRLHYEDVTPATLAGLSASSLKPGSRDPLVTLAGVPIDWPAWGGSINVTVELKQPVCGAGAGFCYVPGTLPGLPTLGWGQALEPLAMIAMAGHAFSKSDGGGYYTVTVDAMTFDQFQRTSGEAVAGLLGFGGGAKIADGHLYEEGTRAVVAQGVFRNGVPYAVGQYGDRPVVAEVPDLIWGGLEESRLLITLGSPADLLVVNQTGAAIGYRNGTFVREIPDAQALLPQEGEREYYSVPTGNYTVVLVPNGEGDFHLGFTRLDGAQTTRAMLTLPTAMGHNDSFFWNQSAVVWSGTANRTGASDLADRVGNVSVNGTADVRLSPGVALTMPSVKALTTSPVPLADVAAGKFVAGLRYDGDANATLTLHFAQNLSADLLLKRLDPTRNVWLPAEGQIDRVGGTATVRPTGDGTFAVFEKKLLGY